jgi:predicted PurR-regulated permease PerM
MRQARLRSVQTIDDEEEDSEQVDWLPLISAWSLAILAVIAVAAVLYFAREPLIPVVTAFVVGIMLSPAARALEERNVPRLLTAVLMVVGTALVIGIVAALIASPLADLAGRIPQIGAKLQVFHGLMDRLRHFEISIGINPSTAPPAIPLPSLEWVPTTLGFLTPPVAGFIYFLVVLLLFISWWPDLRRGLVMTFASRDSRLTVLRIVNEVEASLAAYLLTVACINLCVGVAAGVIAAVTGLPFPFGFGALAATLNFIPIVGPILMTVVFALVGIITAPSLGAGVVPAALFMLVVFLEGQFITPTIIGRRLEINNLAVILSLLFWTWMWGPMGAFLASPLLIVGLIVKEHLRRNGSG